MITKVTSEVGPKYTTVTVHHNEEPGAEGWRPSVCHQYFNDEIEALTAELVRLVTAKAVAENKIRYTEPETIGVGVAPWAADRILIIFDPSTEKHSAVTIDPGAAMKIALDIKKHVQTISSAADRAKKLITPQRPKLIMQ